MDLLPPGLCASMILSYVHQRSQILCIPSSLWGNASAYWPIACRSYTLNFYYNFYYNSVYVQFLHTCCYHCQTMPVCSRAFLHMKLGAKLSTDEGIQNNTHSFVMPYFCIQPYFCTLPMLAHAAIHSPWAYKAVLLTSLCKRQNQQIYGYMGRHFPVSPAFQWTIKNHSIGQSSAVLGVYRAPFSKKKWST